MKSLNYYLQDNINDCGVACLRTILDYYSIEVSKEVLLEYINVDTSGVKAYDLVNASKKLNLDAKGVRCDVSYLKNKLPAIAHLTVNKNFYHYVVVLEINDKTLKIMDPGYGIKTLTIDEFNNESTNIFIIFDKKSVNSVRDNRLKKYLKDLLIDNKAIILKSIIIAIIYMVISIVFNCYLKLVIEYQVNNNFILYLTLFFVNITVLKNIINYFKQKQTLYLNLKIDKKINKNLTKSIFHLPYKYFLQKQTGEFMDIVGDIENFKNIVSKLFILGFIDIIMILIMSIFMLSINVLYFIIMALLFVTLLYISLCFQNILNDDFVILKKNKIKLLSTQIKFLESYETIKNLNIQNKIINKINKGYKDVLGSNKNYINNFNRFDFINNLITELFYILVIFISMVLVKKGMLDLYDVIFFGSLFYLFVSFMSDVLDGLSMYKIYKTSVNRVLDILYFEKEDLSLNSYFMIKNIEFKNVSYLVFEKEVLSNISFSVNENDKVFIYGNSGVGKSTIIKILLRYVKETSGSILINNKDINDINLSELRNNISYVGQNETLYTDTLLNNLKYVTDNMKKIEKVIEIMNINKMFDDGNVDWNFLLEDGGNNLSGGQRKKIMLARGLLKAKSVLILDETFNEISINEEKEILNSIFVNYPNLIIIVISHRKNNMDMFNKIINIKEENI